MMRRPGGADQQGVHDHNFSAPAMLLVCLCAGPLTQCKGNKDRPAPAPATADPLATIVAEVDRREDLIFALAGRLFRLRGDVLNLQLPGARGRALFAARVQHNDLAGDATPRWSDSWIRGQVQMGAIAIDANMATADRDTLALWPALFERVAYFERTGFHLKNGAFAADSPETFRTQASLDGVAHLKSGQVWDVRAMLELDWQREGEGDDAPWTITRWQTVSFDVRQADAPLFEEVTARAIPAAATRQQVQRSLVEQERLQSFLANAGELRGEPTVKLPSHLAVNNMGIAVLDVDDDGADDLYLMPYAGPNVLLRNRGDGSYEDASARYGLDGIDQTGAAVFADFDNDGDLDAFLGRGKLPATYLRNEDGVFVDRSADLVAGPLPYLVMSVSAVDFDNDGLLDVYLSTYGAFAMDTLLNHLDREFATLPEDGMMFGGQRWPAWLPETQARKLYQLVRAGPNWILDRPGPPNVLLRNAGGGKFERVAGAEALETWRNTYQSTWADYDDDGDMDVYVANDYAPNNLIRNEGNGTFVDVTAATGTADIGYGMGASWGDYDSDGRQDLYITNMYSTAGSRITRQAGELGAEYIASARGNTLFRNGPGGFEKVSGTAPPAMTVEKAGWAWGGQFVDLDGDGHLDIYTAAGLYSAPPQIAVPEDT